MSYHLLLYVCDTFIVPGSRVKLIVVLVQNHGFASIGGLSETVVVADSLKRAT
jgi:hypothetical protein